MATQCHNQLRLGFQPKIVLDFNGGEITSDSGLLLLRQFDGQLALTKRLTGLFNDQRNPLFIEHHAHEMLCQRIYQIAAGYEDCNDADALRCDPTFQTIVVNPIPWPLSPRSRAWKITPTSKPSNGWAAWVLSGFCNMGTRNERLPRKSYWTPMLPMIRATA